MRTKMILAGLMVVMVGACGCATRDMETGRRVEVRNQHYEFDTVKRLAEQLQPGMHKFEVMALLGSPAKQERSVWIYLPERSGVLLPAESLHVRFLNDMYVGHEFNLVVLGADTGGG